MEAHGEQLTLNKQLLGRIDQLEKFTFVLVRTVSAIACELNIDLNDLYAKYGTEK